MLTKENNFKVFQFLNFITLLIIPAIALCSVESSLMAVQTKLIGTILPLAAILGLVFAGLSFVAGSPNARNHLILAMIGAAIGFGAVCREQAGMA